jgi:hypothetical protein
MIAKLGSDVSLYGLRIDPGFLCPRQTVLLHYKNNKGTCDTGQAIENLH